MPPSRRDLERPFRRLLPTDLRKIELPHPPAFLLAQIEANGAPERPLTPERRDHLIEMVGNIDLEPETERSLGGIRARDDRTRDALPLGRPELRKHSSDGPKFPAEAELTEDQIIRQLLGQESARSSHDGEGDGEIEARSGLSQITGREVDDDRSRRKRNGATLERSLHPHAALFDLALGHPDQLKRRKPLAEQDLDLDRKGVHPKKPTRVCDRSHAPLEMHRADQKNARESP